MKAITDNPKVPESKPEPKPKSPESKSGSKPDATRPETRSENPSHAGSREKIGVLAGRPQPSSKPRSGWRNTGRTRSRKRKPTHS